jgi:hypothetical protein
MRRFVKWLSYVKEASPYRNGFQQIFDIVQTKIRVNISPAEYYKFAFYKGGKTWAEKSRYIGKLGSLYWPYELNPLKYNAALTNKYVQKNLIMGFALPTPRLIAAVGPQYGIKTYEEFQKFLSRCHQDIVVKPVSSRGGQGVMVLTYRDRGFHTVVTGDHYPAEKIWQHMQPSMKRGILIEEKLTNNRQIAALYPHSLNCFRVVTIKLGDRWDTVFPPYLKIGHGGNVVDNDWQKGGILLFLNGKGNAAMAYAEYSEEQITHHPDTRESLAGIRIEGVEEVRELGLKASRKFSFLGTIGWDIALTGNGPAIIEGNAFWGGLQDQKFLGGFVTDEMTRHLRKHTLFSRWDRMRMYPRFFMKMKAFRN